jgi:hypothetical protein
VEEHPQDHLRILGQLALEYEKKYKELREAVKKAQPETVPPMLRLRGDMTTDQFRAAQVALLSKLAPETDSQEADVHRAATTLCRCFDEMRILLEISLEQFFKSRD